MKNYILTITCNDSPGIVSAITTCISSCQGNITELDQYTDPSTKLFYFRCVFSMDSQKEDELANLTASVKNNYSITLSLKEQNKLKKVAVLCSKKPHCLIHLLEKKRQGALAIDIPCIISNHSDCEKIAKHHGIPFYYLPITKETKTSQEEKIKELITKYDVDLIVLARYMQILSEDFCDHYKGKIINIHHSFLPGFKGANPYKQAFERGVKLIGATSHFVTKDLDEGPIICQETIRVHHYHTVKELIRFGADIEALVLARSLKQVADDKVFIEKNKTVVFK